MTRLPAKPKTRKTVRGELVEPPLFSATRRHSSGRTENLVLQEVYCIAVFLKVSLNSALFMKKDEQDGEIHHYIDGLIFNFLSNKDNAQTLTQNYKTYINDKLVQVNLWSEYIDNHLIQIFEIKIKRTLFEQVYAKGVLFDETGYQIFDNEKLWEYGF